MRLEGKVALITGGARGIGAATARLMAAEGAAVVIADVLEKEGMETSAEISEAGREALFVQLDVTSEADWAAAVQATVSKYGKLDVLVNNAGIRSRTGVEETSVESWDRVMDVNAKGVFLGTKAAIAEMRRAGGGSIINISSIYGIVGSGGSASYHASKGAVRLFNQVGGGPIRQRGHQG